MDFPGSPASLLMIIVRLEFVFCGLLIISATEKLNAAVVMASGVKSFDDMLRAEVKATTSNAQTLGFKWE